MRPGEGGRVAAIVLAGLVAGACGARDEEPGLAMAAVELNRSRAPLGSPVEMTYRFTVADLAPPFAQDYRVMVHFLDADGELMWTDDHDPPVRTTEWRPGRTIEYSRTLFIPVYPYIGPSTITVGLYSPRDQQRLPLEGDHQGQRAYRVGTLDLQPQSESVFLMFRDGWHQVEVAPDNPAVEWQWTRREATLSFRNPRRDAVIYLNLEGRPDLFDEPQEVTIVLGDEPLASFVLEDPGLVLHTIDCPAERFGAADLVEMRLQVDKTFVPAQLSGAENSDPRELGVRVFHVFVEPR